MSEADSPGADQGGSVASETPDTRPEELTTEQRAREMGWTPPDEWQGAPPKNGFLSAEEFVRRGETVIPLLRGQNRKLESEIEAMKRQVAELTTAAQSLNEFNQRSLARERQENERLMRQLEARRDQAVSEGDAPAAVAADRELARLDAERKQAIDPARQRFVEQWLQENRWYADDEHKRAWAEGFARQLTERGYPPGPAILDAVAREYRYVYGNGASAQRPGSVDGRAGRQPPKGNKRTFDDLPQEARDAYRQFARLGVKMTPEQYLDQYDWSDR